MPNAVELLSEDHRKVEQLFVRYQQSHDESVLRTICDELELHTTLEEQFVYPGLRAEVDPDMAEHAQEEHDEATQLIERIRGADKRDLSDLAAELEQAINEHVREEETEVFPTMEQQLGEEWMERVGRELDYAKQASTAPAGSEESVIDLTDLTRDQLYEKAKAADIQGRSRMNKEELARAVQRKG